MNMSDLNNSAGQDEPADKATQQSLLTRRIANYDRLIRSRPAPEIKANCYHLRGYQYFLIEDYDKALTDFKKSIELNQAYSDPAAHADCGFLYMLEGKYDSAIENYSKAIELDKSHADYYYLRGTAYHQLNDYDAALENYSRALELEPKHIKSLLNRSALYVDQEQYNKASEDLTQAINLGGVSTDHESNRTAAQRHAFHTTIKFAKNGPRIPYEVVDASLQNKLVFVVGAGVSKTAGLPDFDELLKQLRAKLEPSLDPDDYDKDEFWKTLNITGERRQYESENIKSKVAEILCEAATETPWLNPYSSIAELSAHYEGVPLVITSNYDNLFESYVDSLSGKSISNREVLDLLSNQSPSGVAHIHGYINIDDPTATQNSDIVFLDRDFTEAYMNTNRWVPNFLSELAEDDYTLVFIGHRGKDQLLNRLLEIWGEEPPGDGGFYAICPMEEIDNWELCNVKPIPYDTEHDEEHYWLRETLSQWSRFKHDPYSRNERLRYTVLSNPFLIPEHERSIALYLLTKQDYFDHIRDIIPSMQAEWIEWLESYWHLLRKKGGTQDILPGEGIFQTLTQIKNLSTEVLPPDEVKALAIWLSSHITNPAILSWVAQQQYLHHFLVELLHKNIESIGNLLPESAKQIWRLVLSPFPENPIDIMTLQIARRGGIAGDIAEKGWNEETLEKLRIMTKPSVGVFNIDSSSSNTWNYWIDNINDRPLIGGLQTHKYPQHLPEIHLPNDKDSVLVFKTLLGNIEYGATVIWNLIPEGSTYYLDAYENLSEGDRHDSFKVLFYSLFKVMGIASKFNPSEVKHLIDNLLTDEEGLLDKVRLRAWNIPELYSGKELSSLLKNQDAVLFHNGLNLTEMHVLLTNRWNELDDSTCLELERKLFLGSKLEKERGKSKTIFNSFQDIYSLLKTIQNTGGKVSQETIEALEKQAKEEGVEDLENWIVEPTTLFFSRETIREPVSYKEQEKPFQVIAESTPKSFQEQLETKCIELKDKDSESSVADTLTMCRAVDDYLKRNLHLEGAISILDNWETLATTIKNIKALNTDYTSGFDKLTDTINSAWGVAARTLMRASAEISRNDQLEKYKDSIKRLTSMGLEYPEGNINKGRVVCSYMSYANMLYNMDKGWFKKELLPCLKGDISIGRYAISGLIVISSMTEDFLSTICKPFLLLMPEIRSSDVDSSSKIAFNNWCRLIIYDHIWKSHDAQLHRLSVQAFQKMSAERRSGVLFALRDKLAQDDEMTEQDLINFLKGHCSNNKKYYSEETTFAYWVFILEASNPTQMADACLPFMGMIKSESYRWNILLDLIPEASKSDLYWKHPKIVKMVVEKTMKDANSFWKTFEIERKQYQLSNGPEAD